MTTIAATLRRAERLLFDHEIECPRANAEWLVSHALNLSKSDIFANSDKHVNAGELQRIKKVLDRRTRGEPVQYITGETEFYNTRLKVGPGVLIPRPETEQLVEIALKYYSGNGPILDLCTGSGAILYAIARETAIRNLSIGIDISADALSWADKNKPNHSRLPIEFIRGDLFKPLHRCSFEIITVNPPYISPEAFRNLPIHIRNFEPSAALLAADDGLAIIRRVIDGAVDFLDDCGWLICEIGESQGYEVRRLLTERRWRNIGIIQDFCDRDRIAVAQK